MADQITDDLRAQIRALVKTDRGFAQRCGGRVIDSDNIDAAITAAWGKGYRSLTGLRDSAIHILEFGDAPAPFPGETEHDDEDH